MKKYNIIFILSFLLGLSMGFAIGYMYAISQVYHFIYNFLVANGIKISDDLLNEMVRYGMTRAGIV